MELRPGTKLHSAVCGAQVIVVRAPATAVDICCGGVPLQEDAPGDGGAATGAPSAEGPLLGKRYADDELGLELLCTRAGTGGLTVAGRPLAVKGAKPLPASD